MRRLTARSERRLSTIYEIYDGEDLLVWFSILVISYVIHREAICYAILAACSCFSHLAIGIHVALNWTQFDNSAIC
jgi:hypothetical protein